MQMDISLKQHLENIGWDKRFLSRDGCFARITSRDFSPCFEPFSWWRRLYVKPLPLEEVFPDRMKIKFLKSLKYETLERRYFMVWLMMPYFWLKDIWPKEFLARSVFKEYLNVDTKKDHPLFSEFPWDQYLRVFRLEHSMAYSNGMDFTQEYGKFWNIGFIPLTYVTQIEILVDDKYSGYSHPPTNPTHWIPRYMQLPS